MHVLQKPLGILGGTFDPIHFGHLRMAIELKESLNLDYINIIPCYQPMHRKPPIANAKARLEMVELAIQHEPSMFLDDREIKRKGPSYTIYTLLELHAERPTTPLCLFVGLDAFLSFNTWERWEEILNLCHIIIAHRPHYQLPTKGLIANLLQERLITDKNLIHKNLSGHILLQPITPLEISASDIRQQFKSGKNPRYLLPNKVFDYIKQNKIYESMEI